MEIYLVRHGEAVSEYVDPAQPLRERGCSEVSSMARHAARIGLSVSEIRHSTKLRAKQTAEILRDHLRPARGLLEVDYLAPSADPGRAQDATETATEPLMLVGHLPHLARLASLLLAGDPHQEILRFRTGAIAKLERTDHGWALGWMLTPEIVESSA
jgi:phosphohistidine phosphatase